MGIALGESCRGERTMETTGHSPRCPPAPGASQGDPCRKAQVLIRCCDHTTETERGGARVQIPALPATHRGTHYFIALHLHFPHL